MPGYLQRLVRTVDSVNLSVELAALFRHTGGAEAAENAFTAVREVTERRRFASVDLFYINHGALEERQLPLVTASSTIMQIQAVQ